MNVPFLDLRRRVAATRPGIEREIARVLENGTFILGPAVQRFEEAFATYCGARYAVGVASGTDAITLSLEGLGIGAGDEVITAANTCVPTVTAIRSTGATPVLIDAHPSDWTLQPEALDQARTERTRAIVPVHLYGRLADMPAIRSFADEYELAVVEDAAQAHGASLAGARAGTLGHAAAFSFYPTKNLGGLGDGGMVLTDDARLAEAVRTRRNYGFRGDTAINLGRNSRLDELQAATLMVGLERLDADNARRSEIAAFYRAALSASSAEMQAQTPGWFPAWHLFVLAVPDRNDFRRRMEDQGVGTHIHYPRAIHQQPAFNGVARVAGPLDTSERLARAVVSLPLNPELTDAEVHHVAQAAAASLGA